MAWEGAECRDGSESASHRGVGAGDLGLGKWTIPGQILPSRCNGQSDELVEKSYTRSGDFDPYLEALVLEVVVLGCKTPFPTLAHVKIQAATLLSITGYF